MFENIDPMAVALLGFAVVGTVELVKRLFAKDYKAAAIITASTIVGAVLAPQAGNITWFQGMLVGLQASGFITTAGYLVNSKP